jgi:hypothetical protein
MLALFCPRHGHRVLLDLDRITRMVPVAAGMTAVEARCYDGELLLTIIGPGARLTPDEVATRPAAPPAG